jgi:hypothetical protein
MFNKLYAHPFTLRDAAGTTSQFSHAARQMGPRTLRGGSDAERILAQRPAATMP